MKGARTGQRIGTRGIRSLHSSRMCEATQYGNEDAACEARAQCSASLPLPTRTSNHKPSPLAYTTKDVEEKPQSCTQITRERPSGCIHMSFGCDLMNLQHTSQAPSPAPSSASGRSAFSKGKDKLKRMFRQGVGKEVRQACE